MGQHSSVALMGLRLPGSAQHRGQLLLLLVQTMNFKHGTSCLLGLLLCIVSTALVVLAACCCPSAFAPALSLNRAEGRNMGAG